MIRTLVNLPKLGTCEDENAQFCADRVEAAAPYAEAMILSGPLLVGDHACARLSRSIGDFSKTPGRGGDPAREEAAYQIGLAVGLRLGQMNGGAR